MPRSRFIAPNSSFWSAEVRCEQTYVVATTRKNGRNTSTDGTLAGLEFSVAADEGGVADFDASDIGNGVEHPGSAIERNTESAGTDGLRGGRWRGLRFAGLEKREEAEESESDEARCDVHGEKLRFN